MCNLLMEIYYEIEEKIDEIEDEIESFCTKNFSFVNSLSCTCNNCSKHTLSL